LKNNEDKYKRFIINVSVVWGGFSVSSATINRFFSLHFTLPFILAALVAGHLLYLHISGSSNPVCTTGNTDRTAFHPYFSFKDLVTIYLFFVLFAIILFFAPDKLGLWMAFMLLNIYDLNDTKCLNTILYTWVQKISNSKNFQLLYWLNLKLFLLEFKVKLVISRKINSIIRCFRFIIVKIIILTNLFKKNENIKSSEIMCVNTCALDNDIINVESDNNFSFWLSGLIDGDGSLLVNKNKALTCEITVQARDIEVLFLIKERYQGSVLKRSNVNAYRWRVSKKINIVRLYNDINGKLISDGKQIQLVNVGKALNIEPNLVKNYKFDLNSAWLAGFSDADGYVSITNRYTLAISISQKSSGILYSIEDKLSCGRVYYDKGGDTFNYAITDLNGIKRMLLYLEKYPLKTTKYSDSMTFRKLIEYLELKYHHKNSPYKSIIDNYIKLFKDRYKI